MKCVFVLGAPRTGSSCLAGCIHYCGVDLGKSLSGVKDKHNEKGYFENEAILGFNRLIFQALGFNWHERDLTPEEEHLTLRHKASLVQILKEEYSEDLFAIKDFRLGIFNKLYLSAVGDLKVIVVNRSKQAVIASMKKMFGWKDDQKATWMVERCYRLFDVYQCPRLIVSFEDLLDDPLYTMSHVCEFMGVDFDEEKQQRVSSFVEKRLVHESSA